jgi:glycosyltransferase involved in cell wall biosynthesis
MTVSLIVCTRNRASRLPVFLARLSLLEPPPGGWELILVDNGSTDGSAAQIAAFAAGALFPVRALHAPVAGLGRARNVGMSHARGRILAFTDDDCYPSADYLRALVAVFEEHPIGFVGGRVVLHDPTDARIGIKDAETASEIPPHSFLPTGTIHGANMAVLREVVEMIGGFDPLLGAGTPSLAGEDIEYVARAAWAGWRGRYDPRPVVAHHHGRKPGPDADRQKRGYDYGRGAYFAKLVVNRRARGTYLRGWYRRTRRGFGITGVSSLGRELAGGTRYLLQRWARPEPVPGFGPLPAASSSLVREGADPFDLGRIAGKE